MSDVRWLTYDELSAELNITRESARQLVIRKRWARQKGNDAKTRVGVPEEALQARTAPLTSDPTPADTSDDTPHETFDATSVIPVLTRHIERIEKELQTLTAKLESVESERDSECQRANELALQAATVEPMKVTIEALRASLESEKHHLNELRQEKDRWQQLATAPRGFFSWFRRSA